MTKRNRWIALAAISLAVLVPLGIASAQAITKPANSPEVPASGNNAPPGSTTTDNTPSTNPATNPASPAAGKAPSQGLFDSPMIWVLFGLIIVMFWWSSRGKKKQEQKHRDMLSALKKGDKITTIGGIIGTVIEVRDDEVVVKVDETNNVRMRFIRGAIRDVGQPKGDALDQKK